jgi:hypothetical protein
MRAAEIVFEILFTLVGIALAAAIIRYPKAVFIDIPLGLIKKVLHIDFFVGLFEIFTGGEKGDTGYKIQKKVHFNFANCHKLLLVKGANESKVKNEIKEALSTIAEKSKSIDFTFTRLKSELVIKSTNNIPFYEFHFLVQWLTEAKMETIGLIESEEITYSVYSDPNSINLIGQTDKGSKFFITLLEGYEDKQFVSINKDIEINSDYCVEEIKKRLVSV